MMEYVYFYNTGYYTIYAGCPVVADRLFNKLMHSTHAAADATVVSIKVAA